jgi:hypothetical protein
MSVLHRVLPVASSRLLDEPKGVRQPPEDLIVEFELEGTDGTLQDGTRQVGPVRMPVLLPASSRKR